MDFYSTSPINFCNFILKLQKLPWHFDFILMARCTFAGVERVENKTHTHTHTSD